MIVLNIIIKSIKADLKKQMATQTDTSSIHQILELFKYLKSTGSDLKQRDLSTLSFSSKNYQSNRNALDSISIENIYQLPGHSSTTNNWATTNQFKSTRDNKNTELENQQKRAKHNNNKDIFNKLYKDGKQSQMKKCILEYKTRRSKELKQKNQCTFSPNIRSRFRVKAQQRYDSIEDNDAFYNKNISWQQRKDNNIKILQCQKNIQHANQLTFTPRINKNAGFKRKDMDKHQSSLEQIHRSKECKVTRNKGVYDFLQRQQKAKKHNQYVKNRQKNPYSHIWNIKKGQFSDAR